MDDAEADEAAEDAEDARTPGAPGNPGDSRDGRSGRDGRAGGAGTRPGGRTARVRSQVLESVGPLLMEYGYDGLTIEAVAIRSGVHRATVYRRWRDVGGLLADTLDAAGDDTWRPADTGTLEGDLLALNEELLAALQEEPSLATALIAASFRSEEAATALRRFWEERYERCEVIVARAVARGEIAASTDARQLLVHATAPLYHEAVLLHTAADPDLPARSARAAVLAARGGAFSRASADCPAG
ncbi:TetR family transcriptional regulator [Streptomyces sp. NHF165]|uniref:TetR/AcrR family transcriptional regulator n=1 Tax=Streptomyces sp. NHF165 TaxID=2175864 RepID=UPI00132F2D77|nr:TetR/AcrR family transcriptional regulator [Streptomyces sp. NHF165]QHF97801.1 TetR family transcriptional regulator [Streptomyces sp. NHF165]